MKTYTKPQQWKEEESEKLRGDGGQVKFIDSILVLKDDKLKV